MPYKPNEPTEQDRSRIYSLIWLGVAGAFIATGLHLANPAIKIPGILIGFPIGGIIGGASVRGFDDYYRALTTTGFRFMAVFIGLYVFAAWISNNFDASGNLIISVRERVNDGMLVALLAMSASYLSHSYAWLRDHFF